MSEPPRQNDLSKQVLLTRGASYLVFQSVGLNVIAILSFVVLARLISTKEMGIWSILLLIDAACITFVTWFPSAVTKYIAEENASGTKAAAAAVFYQALRANILTYLPVTAGMYLGATFLAFRLLGDQSYAPLFQLLALDVFLSGAILQIGTAAMLGLGRFKETALVGLVAGGVFRQSLIILLIIVMKNFAGLVIGWVVSDGLYGGIFLIIIIRALGKPRFDYSLRKMFHYYLPLELSQIVSYAQTWFDRVVLVGFVPLAALGVYNAAATAFSVLPSISWALVSMLFPAFSAIEWKTSAPRMREAIRLGTRYSTFVLTPLAFGLLATAKPALTLFVGEPYVTGFLPLTILCAAFAFTAFATALSPALLAIEETRIIGAINAGSVMVGFVAAYFLMPTFGILGASMARALSMLLAVILIIPVLGRKIALHLDFRSITKTLFAGCVMAAVLFAAQLVHYSKFMMPLYILIGAVVYLVMLRLLKLVDRNDMALVQGFLGKRLEPVGRLLGRILLTN